MPRHTTDTARARGDNSLYNEYFDLLVIGRMSKAALPPYPLPAWPPWMFPVAREKQTNYWRLSEWSQMNASQYAASFAYQLQTPVTAARSMSKASHFLRRMQFEGRSTKRKKKMLYPIPAFWRHIRLEHFLLIQNRRLGLPAATSNIDVWQARFPSKLTPLLHILFLLWCESVRGRLGPCLVAVTNWRFLPWKGVVDSAVTVYTSIPALILHEFDCNYNLKM